MKPKKLFPEVPADLSDLDRDALTALETSMVDAARLCAAGDAEFTDGVDDAGQITQMTEAVVELERIRAALTAIGEGEAEFAATMSELSAQFGIEDAPEGDAVEQPAETLSEAAPADGDDSTEDDPEDETTEEPSDEASATAEVVEEVAEPVTASAVRLRRPPAAPASHRPRVTTPEQGAPLLASAGLEGAVRPGQVLDRASLALALGEAQAIGTARSSGEKVIVASAQFRYPDDRQLIVGNPAQNWERIFKHTQGEAVVASGGFCAVFPPRYDLPILATAIRPVRDSLPTFGTPRGGVQFPTPLGLADVTGGISVITAAQDEAGGTAGMKACVVIDCDDFQSAEVQAIAACVEHGNLNARAWPERVDNVAELLAAAHAQAAETELLAAMTALSENVVDEAKYGAYATLIQGILKAGAAYRSRHRMDPNTALHVWMPAWVIDMIAVEFAYNGFSRLDAAAARSNVTALFARNQIRVTWYVDQDGTTQQVYGAQAGSGAQLLEFLTHVIWYIAAEGTFGFLDFGRLDLGLVRDSGLNATNDFNVFWETFEGLAKFGIEALRVDSTVCPSGATAPAGTVITC